MSSEIWLKISNVRKDNTKVQVRFEADKGDDKEKQWWIVDPKAYGKVDDDALYRGILDGMDKKHIVLGKLGISTANSKSEICCKVIRVQFAE